MSTPGPFRPAQTPEPDAAEWTPRGRAVWLVGQHVGFTVGAIGMYVLAIAAFMVAFVVAARQGWIAIDMELLEGMSQGGGLDPEHLQRSWDGFGMVGLAVISMVMGVLCLLVPAGLLSLLPAPGPQARGLVDRLVHGLAWRPTRWEVGVPAALGTWATSLGTSALTGGRTGWADYDQVTSAQASAASLDEAVLAGTAWAIFGGLYMVTVHGWWWSVWERATSRGVAAVLGVVLCLAFGVVAPGSVLFALVVAFRYRADSAVPVVVGGALGTGLQMGIEVPFAVSAIAVPVALACVAWTEWQARRG